MRLRTQSRAELSAQFGYLDAEGRPSDRGIANILRAPLSRWGLSPKRSVLKQARAEFRASGVDEVGDIPRVLRRLVDIGECEEVYVGHEVYLAPTTPRWLSVGEGISVYLGVSGPPDGLSLVDSNHRDIVRRLCVGTDEEAAMLELAGVREVSLSEWLMPLGYLRHASRRMRQPARSDAIPLERFWDLLEEALTEEGLTVSADAEVRFLEGRPGDFFGRHNSSQPEGRWTRDPGEGLWCAYRRGYGDTHWHPCIIAVTGDGQRALDLFDVDEWRWAVLARGRRVGAEEVVGADGLKVQLTFPAPFQLRAAMDILGSPSDAWSWEVSPNGPDVWRLLT
ncbi:MAG: hypothetical protein LC667_16150 [Thioalkalivibrio sp.]|nr:hypothetical protein [Thioalkalivibrio sp.]